MPEEPFHIPETEEEEIPEADGRLRQGDKVMIGVDPDVFQSIHKEMKLWKDKMMEVNIYIYIKELLTLSEHLS